MTLLVAGSLHLDVVLRAPHLPGLDETVTGSTVDYVFGGKGGNQAQAAVRMGADVAFVGRAGSDPFGDMIRETLKRSGMDLSQLQRDPGASGMSAAIVDANGDYGAVIVSAANLNIAVDAVEVPKGTSLVVLQNEIPDAVNVGIARKAKAQGARVWLNAAPARAVSEALSRLVDLMVVNRVEATFYAAQDAPDMLTTLGADGVSYQGRQFPAVPVEVASTHGAGDMFVGALAAEVARGASMEQAIAFAQAAAAFHVSLDIEARKGLSREAVISFAKTRPIHIMTQGSNA